jgi:hypothetical protein
MTASERRHHHRLARKYAIVFGAVFGLIFCVPGAVIWDAIRLPKPPHVVSHDETSCDMSILKAGVYPVKPLVSPID